MRLTLSDTRLDGRNAWVAEIMGTDPQYHLSRRFLRTDRKSRTITVDLESGEVYEVSCPDEEDRYFAEVRKGLLTRISQASVRNTSNGSKKSERPSDGNSTWRTPVLGLRAGVRRSERVG